MNFIHSALDTLRDRYAPVSHTSTFRQTGQITPEEFVLAGDFLVYKFPSWSWSDASHPSKRANYLPEGKQFLVTRGVPCHRRLDDNFAGEGASEDVVGKDEGDADGDEEGWLRTGGEKKDLSKDVRTLDGSGNVGDESMHEEDEIPDMEDDEDDDEAIIRDKQDTSKTARRNYNLYITYTPYYRTPRMYLSGYTSASEPLPPTAMFDDIMGDYKDKTVTLEDFPFFDAGQSVKMASIHPCRHASVMKSLLDRADAALKLRRDRVRQGKATAGGTTGMEGLVDETRGLAISDGHKAGVAAAGGSGGDEWEVLQHEGEGEEESAIRVDQYLVVFLKYVRPICVTLAVLLTRCADSAPVLRPLSSTISLWVSEAWMLSKDIGKSLL